MLDVLLYDRTIGVIVCEPGTGVLSFVFNESYLDDPEHPVLGQQFEERRHHRVFRQAAHPGRLPSFFANLLPLGALQSMIAAQTADGSDAGTLAFVGEDLPGAVAVRGTTAAMLPDQAPAYDFVFVRNYPGLDRRLALPLAKEREPERIGWEHFQRVERFLRDHGLDEPIVKAAREFAALALQSWRDHQGDVEPEFRRRLDAYHDALPIVSRD